MERTESDRLNTRSRAWVRTEDVDKTLSLFSLLSQLPNLLYTVAVSTFHEYSKQIEWWSSTSKTMVYLSFLYTITTLQFLEGFLILMTGWTMTLNLVLAFCICQLFLTTNFTQLAKNITEKIRLLPR